MKHAKDFSADAGAFTEGLESKNRQKQSLKALLRVSFRLAGQKAAVAVTLSYLPISSCLKAKEDVQASSIDQLFI